MTLNLAQTSVAKSRPSVPYERNLFLFVSESHVEQSFDWLLIGTDRTDECAQVSDG